MVRSVRIMVDLDKCVGSRICTSIAPAVFGLDANGQARVIDADADTLATILAAADGCPLGAITVEQSEGEGLASRAEGGAKDHGRQADGKDDR